MHWQREGKESRPVFLVLTTIQRRRREYHLSFRACSFLFLLLLFLFCCNSFVHALCFNLATALRCRRIKRVIGRSRWGGWGWWWWEGDIIRISSVELRHVIIISRGISTTRCSGVLPGVPITACHDDHRYWQTEEVNVELHICHLFEYSFNSKLFIRVYVILRISINREGGRGERFFVGRDMQGYFMDRNQDYIEGITY